MAMEFTYKVSGIKVYTTDSQTDIIKEATLHIIGTQEDQQYESFMPIELSEPSDSFTEFHQVSASQVEAWLKGTLGEEQLAANKEGLESMYNNPMFSKTATRDNPEEKDLLEG
tara:strand:+ start:288 stop:626 length:339 start_codon:yes stop_codon:yes gene_type:complete